MVSGDGRRSTHNSGALGAAHDGGGSASDSGGDQGCGYAQGAAAAARAGRHRLTHDGGSSAAVRDGGGGATGSGGRGCAGAHEDGALPGDGQCRVGRGGRAEYEGDDNKCALGNPVPVVEIETLRPSGLPGLMLFHFSVIQKLGVSVLRVERNNRPVITPFPTRDKVPVRIHITPKMSNRRALKKKNGDGKHCAWLFRNLLPPRPSNSLWPPGARKDVKSQRWEPLQAVM